jgi:2-dehydro-3-deoxyphosphogluconate aldolase / (4S)-4-hydroxy-2-oxoglutarate aldolase
MPDPVTEALSEAGIVPVIVMENPERARPLAQSLRAGGLGCAEVTFRTASARDCLAEMASDPEMLVGAGTVLSPAQVDSAVEAGARYIVTPGFSAGVVKAAQAAGIPVFPGVATATEIQMALEFGLETLKLFPAESIGGLGLIKALSAPFPMVRFIPTGGIGPKNAADYLGSPAVRAIGGSWMATSAMIAGGRFDEIIEATAQAVAIRDQARQGEAVSR